MDKIWWLIFGFAGQALFAARFIVQWFFSEKVKKSIIPIHFWYFSLAGGIVMLIYVIHLRDPVLILGQLSGLLVYGRNLYFIFQERKKGLMS